MIKDFGRIAYYMFIDPYKSKLQAMNIKTYLTLGLTTLVACCASTKLIIESIHLDSTRTSRRDLRDLASISSEKAEMKPATGAFT